MVNHGAGAPLKILVGAWFYSRPYVFRFRPKGENSTNFIIFLSIIFYLFKISYPAPPRQWSLPITSIRIAAFWILSAMRSLTRK